MRHKQSYREHQIRNIANKKLLQNEENNYFSHNFLSTSAENPIVGGAGQNVLKDARLAQSINQSQLFVNLEYTRQRLFESIIYT